MNNKMKKQGAPRGPKPPVPAPIAPKGGGAKGGKKPPTYKPGK